MNILFLLKSLETGGLEVVTSVLANKFVTEGHRICVFAFLSGKNSIANRLNEKVVLVTGGDYKANRYNVKKLRKVLLEYHIDIIINQWGLPLVPIRTARRAAKGLDLKIISVYHNAPSFNGRIQSVNIKLSRCENPVKRSVLKVRRWLFKEVTSHAMRYVYRKSDRFLVLSDCYKEEFLRFTRLKDARRLDIMINPVTINAEGYVFRQGLKRKEIIYVGRLDFVQKRVSRVIDTWSYLEKQNPDWHLSIVGDGESRKDLERHVEELGLRRISFEGFQSPLKYYERASVLLLTSDFEGFPLVLAEAMSFGVVPVVYHSFAAVDDIIENGVNGVIIPFEKGGYNAAHASMMFHEIMQDDALRSKMAKAAIEKSKEYSIGNIYKNWEKLFKQLA